MRLSKAQRRYLARAVERFHNPSKRTGTWEHIRSGRSGPALRALARLGYIRLVVDPERTDAYLTWFEIEATPAGLAALSQEAPHDR